MTAILLLLLQFTSFSDHLDPHVILSGNWQSCLVNGSYSEEIYDHMDFDAQFHPFIDWSLHLGPYTEFALFKGRPDYKDDDYHTTPKNLLGETYKAKDPTSMLDHRRWIIKELGLQIDVRKAGGSRHECESYFIEVLRIRGK